MAHVGEAFAGVSKFSRVLVLNCDMKSLIELQSRAKTLAVDDHFACSTHSKITSQAHNKSLHFPTDYYQNVLD